MTLFTECQIWCMPMKSSGNLALIENGWRVLFTRTTDLVRKLQIACRMDFHCKSR